MSEEYEYQCSRCHNIVKMSVDLVVDLLCPVCEHETLLRVRPELNEENADALKTTLEKSGSAGKEIEKCARVYADKEEGSHNEPWMSTLKRELRNTPGRSSKERTALIFDNAPKLRRAMQALSVSEVERRTGISSTTLLKIKGCKGRYKKQPQESAVEEHTKIKKLQNEDNNTPPPSLYSINLESLNI